VTEETAEVGGVGEAEAGGGRVGGPLGVVEETARFEQSPFVDDLVLPSRRRPVRPG
jgi:hypothetical protein